MGRVADEGVSVMLSDSYIGWGLALPICLFLVYGFTSIRTMETLGYPQKNVFFTWLTGAIPGGLLFTFWCSFNIPLMPVYMIAFFCHMLHWHYTRNTWEEKLFAINLLHIITMSIHMTLIGLCALALKVPMGDVIGRPSWRIITISVAVSARVLTDLLLPRRGLPLEVIRTQTGAAEKEPFMAFLWFCSIFMCLDSLLCQTSIKWTMLPVLLIICMVFKQFFILRCLVHLYSVMRAHHFEDQHKALEAELEQQNQQAAALQSKRDMDALTGIYSRRYFMEQMECFLSQGGGQGGALVYIDLDRLKQINDTLGHTMGDQYLIVFAHTFGAYLGAEDVFARLGGDEFAVLLPDCCENDARIRLEEIRFRLARKECCGNTISFSFGVAGITGTQNNAAELIRCADLDMYRDKEQRR